MASIGDPQLTIEAVEGKPGRRRVNVSYDIEMTDQELAEGAEIVERAVVRSVDLHDATGRPTNLEVVIDHRGVIDGPGSSRRVLSTEVKRSDLDVQQDWWRTDHGGGVEAIAEFPDHVEAEITVSVDDRVVADAVTPVVSGSWGALGHD